MIQWLIRLLAGKANHADLSRCINCGAMKPALDLNWGLCETCRWRAWKEEADNRMRDLPVETPVTDWDVAQAFKQPEPEPGRVEYRFLGVTGFEEDA